MLVQGHFESLPYIDGEPTDQEIAAARRLIENELDPNHASEPHPLLPKDHKSYLTDLLEREIINREQGEVEKGIDLERYQNLHDENGQLDMAKAYTALGYSRSRNENLEILKDHGKNQWLVGNDQLEQEAALVEQELRTQRQRIEQINQQRKQRQLEAKPTLDYLESRWKSSLQGLVDVNVACAKLQQEVDSRNL